MFISFVLGGESRRATQAKPRWSRLISAFALLMLAVQSTGCVSGPGAGLLEGPINGYRNHVWANRAYNLRYGHCDHDFEDHFKQGFIDGYNDVSNGGDGYVPAVPPEHYWSYQYQSPEGAKCVNTWFKAYPLGVKAAREDGSGAFQKVYISKMIQSAITQSKADHVLPDDVPVVSTNQKSDQQTREDRFVTDPSFAASHVQTKTANRDLDSSFQDK